MFTNKKILVVEAEFLIALEIQRILEQANAAEMAFARSVTEAAGLEPHFAEFDLAVVAIGNAHAAATELVARLQAADVAVVTITAMGSLDHLPATMRAHLVEKPFADEQLLAACAGALASLPVELKDGQWSVS